jgi:hypothetical protein
VALDTATIQAAGRRRPIRSARLFGLPFGVVLMAELGRPPTVAS